MELKKQLCSQGHKVLPICRKTSGNGLLAEHEEKLPGNCHDNRLRGEFHGLLSDFCGSIVVVVLCSFLYDQKGND